MAPSVACRRWDPDAAAILRTARGARGWSRESVAQVVGCNRATVWGLETARRAPSESLAAALCRALGITGAERRRVLAAARPGVGWDSPYGRRESRRTTVRADRRRAAVLAMLDEIDLDTWTPGTVLPIRRR